MAVRDATVTRTENGYTLVVWTGLKNGDTGRPVNVAQFADKTVQAVGNFAGSGKCAIEGSNDLTAFGVLRDAGGTDLGLLGTQPNIVAENTVQIRPHITVGNGTTDIDLYMVCVGSK